MSPKLKHYTPTSSRLVALRDAGMSQDLGDYSVAKISADEKEMTLRRYNDEFVLTIVAYALERN